MSNQAGQGSRNDGNDGSIDHALLESLFYDEMMLMDDSSSVSPDFMAYLSADAGSSAPDARTIAERAMLNDFGVAQMPPADVPEPSVQQQPQPQQQQQQRTASMVRSVPEQLRSWSNSLVPQAEALQQQFTQGSSSTSTQPTTLQDRAKQLVSQFAALAGRLGITLPSNFLSSLTQQARDAQDKNPSKVEPTTGPENVPALNLHVPELNTRATVPESSTTGSTEVVATSLHNTAEAAIAAVSNSRKRPQPSAETTKPPLYSKRRKKPRLSDCESKLASLKAENEMLKRHLANVSQRSEKFEEERRRQEQSMRQMAQEEADPVKLKPLLSKFTEMYSDYGRHREEELSFHLKQLERLAAPTNFTKMGLWALGQSEAFYRDPKKNPIAGILGKELGITPQQGRKILEKRQKMKDLCMNLKESLGLLAKLKSVCELKQKVYHDRMAKCQQILTPQQVTKLLLWVDDHSQTLEKVCPGWGSERIH